MLVNNGFTSLFFVLAAATGTRNVTYYSFARPRLLRRLVVTQWRYSPLVLGIFSSRSSPTRLSPISHHRGVWTNVAIQHTSNISWVRIFISPSFLTSNYVQKLEILCKFIFIAKIYERILYPLLLSSVRVLRWPETAACHAVEERRAISGGRTTVSVPLARQCTVPGCLCLPHVSSGTSSGRLHIQKIRS